MTTFHVLIYLLVTGVWVQSTVRTDPRFPIALRKHPHLADNIKEEIRTKSSVHLEELKFYCKTIPTTKNVMH